MEDWKKNLAIKHTKACNHIILPVYRIHYYTTARATNNTVKLSTFERNTPIILKIIS